MKSVNVVLCEWHYIQRCLCIKIDGPIIYSHGGDPHYIEHCTVVTIRSPTLQWNIALIRRVVSRRGLTVRKQKAAMILTFDHYFTGFKSTTRPIKENQGWASKQYSFIKTTDCRNRNAGKWSYQRGEGEGLIVGLKGV